MKLRNVLGIGLIVGLLINAMASGFEKPQSTNIIVPEGQIGVPERQNAAHMFPSMMNNELPDKAKSPTYMEIRRAHNINYVPLDPKGDAPPYLLSFKHPQKKGSVIYSYKRSRGSDPEYIRINYVTEEGDLGPMIEVWVADSDSSCLLYYGDRSDRYITGTPEQVKDISLRC